MPGSPLAARGYAATACWTDGMLVWGGAQPGADLRYDLQTGGAVYEGGAWRSVPDAPLSPRMSPSAGWSQDHVLVWGGQGDLMASEDPSDFEFYTDGAILDLIDGTWETTAPSPLSARSDASILDVGNAFLVHGGLPPPGPHPLDPPSAAIYDLQTDSWELIAGPPEGTVVVSSDSFVAYARDGIYRYEGDSDEWLFEEPYPDGIDAPMALGSSGEQVVGASGSEVWIRSDEFESLPTAPVTNIDHVGWLGDSVAVWSSEDGAVAILDPESNTWQRLIAAPLGQPRAGASICIDDSTPQILIWGGWIDRTSFTLASDSGARISAP